eukprot:3251295-Pleurochrysis_carterae.AAC.1
MASTCRRSEEHAPLVRTASNGASLSRENLSPCTTCEIPLRAAFGEHALSFLSRARACNRACAPRTPPRPCRRPCTVRGGRTRARSRASPCTRPRSSGATPPPSSRCQPPPLSSCPSLAHAPPALSTACCIPTRAAPSHAPERCEASSATRLAPPDNLH